VVQCGARTGGCARGLGRLSGRWEAPLTPWQVPLLCSRCARAVLMLRNHAALCCPCCFCLTHE
jgi:hypothetical protein